MDDPQEACQFQNSVELFPSPSYLDTVQVTMRSFYLRIRWHGIENLPYSMGVSSSFSILLVSLYANNFFVSIYRGKLKSTFCSTPEIGSNLQQEERFRYLMWFLK